MPDLGAVWDEEVAGFVPEEAKIAAEGKEKRSSPGEGAGESYWDPDKQAKVWRRQLTSARNQLNQQVQEQRLKSHGAGVGGWAAGGRERDGMAHPSSQYTQKPAFIHKASS